jgi:hypothetical protein
MMVCAGPGDFHPRPVGAPNPTAVEWCESFGSCPVGPLMDPTPPPGRDLLGRNNLPADRPHMRQEEVDGKHGSEVKGGSWRTEVSKAEREFAESPSVDTLD